MKSEFREKTHRMAERFLVGRGYEVIDSSPNIEAVDLVAKSEDGEIVFVALAAKVAAEAKSALPEDTCDRRAMELAAAEWLSSYEFTNISVRFDSIAMLIMSNSRALLRHHKNILG